MGLPPVLSFPAGNNHILAKIRTVVYGGKKAAEVSRFMGYFKERMICEKHPELRYKCRNREF